MYKTSNHSNRIAGRAVTRSVSVIHFRVGTSQSALGIGPDDWYAHISILWQKDWQKTPGVGRGGRLTLLGGRWLPLRLPFCGIQHRDRNKLVKTVADNDCSRDYVSRIPLVRSPSLDWWLLRVLRFQKQGYQLQRHSTNCFSLNLVWNYFTSSSQADWTSWWGLDQLLGDWTVCFHETLRSSAGSISDQPINDQLFFPNSNNVTSCSWANTCTIFVTITYLVTWTQKYSRSKGQLLVLACLFPFLRA